MKAYVLALLSLWGGAWCAQNAHDRSVQVSKVEPEPKSAHETLEAIEKQMHEQNRTTVASAEARLFVNKDFAELDRRILEDKVIRHRIDSVFEAGIVLSDRGELKSFSSEDFRRVYLTTMRYVQEKKDKYQGRDARTVHLALRLLGKFPQPEPRSQEYAQTVDLLDPGLHSDLRDAALGVMAMWKPYPARAADDLKRQIFSMETHRARFGISVAAQLRDPMARGALLNAMADDFGKLTVDARPIAFKTWVTYRKFIKRSPVEELTKAVQREGETWEDAAVYAIETLGESRPYEEYLRKVASVSKDPIMQSRISRLLGRSPAQAGESKP